MMTKIKICGIYRNEDAEFINKYRPDYFGMIMDFPKSHRSVDYNKARELRGLIDKDIPAVGVFVNKPVCEIEALLNKGIIDIAQLHGIESEDEIRYLQERTKKPVWKAFKVRGSEDIAAAKKSPAELILLDNGYGTGETFNWALAEKFDRDFALAGGLNIENIKAAKQDLAPYLLDISSGVETDKIKDENKIREAVALAHEMKGDTNV